MDASSLDLPTIPALGPPEPIPLIIYNEPAYLDTAVTLIPSLDSDGNPLFELDPVTGLPALDSDGNPIPILEPAEIEIGGVNYTGTPFTFPIDSVKTLSAEFYNSMIAGPANNILDSIFGVINNAAPINLGLDALLPDTDPQFISSIDSINISSTGDSYFSTKMVNRGVPTGLVSAYSRLVTGTEALDDTIASHENSLLQAGESLNETKDLAAEGLAQLLQITTGFQIEYAPIGSFVTLYPPGDPSGNAPNDSMYVNFSLQFNLDGVESMDVSIDSVGLAVPKPEIPFAATENEDGSSTSLELYRAELAENSQYLYNRVQIVNLKNTFPFDIDFLLDFKNFFDQSGNSAVKLDTVVSSGSNSISANYDLNGATMRAVNPDSAINKLDLDLAVSIPTQKVTIPLDGSSLGG